MFLWHSWWPTGPNHTEHKGKLKLSVAASSLVSQGCHWDSQMTDTKYLSLEGKKKLSVSEVTYEKFALYKRSKLNKAHNSYFVVTTGN